MTLIGSIVRSLQSFSRARAERSSEDAVHPVTSVYTQPSHSPQQSLAGGSSRLGEGFPEVLSL